MELRKDGLSSGVKINRRNLNAVKTAMRQRYRLYRRKKGGRYYIHDDVTGKQDSLHTSDRAAAMRLFHSRNEAEQQPAVNLQIARAYLAVSDLQILGASQSDIAYLEAENIDWEHDVISFARKKTRSICFLHARSRSASDQFLQVFGVARALDRDF